MDDTSEQPADQAPQDYGTSGGAPIDDALIQRVANEAEAGYDLDKLRPRRR